MTISFLTLTKYCIAVGDFGFHLNAFFGPILIFLTVFGIKGQFGSYKKLLVNFQVIGFVFALIDFLSPTLLHTYNRTLVYFSLSHPFGLSNDSIEWMIAAYCGIFCSTLCLLAIQFLFRFWAVFDTKKLIYFEGLNYFIWIVYYSFFGCLWAYGVGHFFALDSYGTNYLSKEILDKYEKNITGIPILSLVSYDEEGKLRWQSLCGLSIITGISTVQYSIITVCLPLPFDFCTYRNPILPNSRPSPHQSYYFPPYSSCYPYRMPTWKSVFHRVFLSVVSLYTQLSTRFSELGYEDYED
ncbi:hypothetical protein CAEBREN_28262 [Caenorhabditis brenneri]|uniref:Uncharacterized protein n=1 Tax=Caenorhabditis brenneri TaxID=135651 RepID=G0NQR2_CAEBE|nr:hypothetical protein CAEBREN_28262 [Caenorhabditis brenneri]